MRAQPSKRWPSWLPALGMAAVLLFAWSAFLRGDRFAVTVWVLLQLPIPLLAIVVGIVTLIRAIRRRAFTAARLTTLALVVAAMLPLSWSSGRLLLAFPSSLAKTRPSATVRLPADVPLHVMWGGDRLATNRHAFVPAQRWAYDLAVDPVFVHSPRLEAYGCWRVPVLAPADGRITLADDGTEDHVPGKPSNDWKRPLGNAVAIELATHTFLVIGHLAKGSVTVKLGDEVHEGQLIGRCGNSGNTSEPHIHIHHQRQDPRLDVQMAEGLPLFFRDTEGPPMPEGGVRAENGRYVPRGPVVKSVRARD